MSNRGAESSIKWAQDMRLLKIERDHYRAALETIASGQYGIKPKRFVDTILSRTKTELRRQMARI